MTVKDKQVVLKKTAELEKMLKAKNGSNPLVTVALINDEIIKFEMAKFSDDCVTLLGCTRGFLMTNVKEHPANEKVEFLYFSGYSNLFPGTLKFSERIARNIGNKAKEGHFDKVTLDGHESALQTGHGVYAMNDTFKIIYEINKDRDMIYSGSCMTNYCWNIISYISWGEFDIFKGFRGTMLDYRIRRQLQLGRSLMPKKLGQHYPNKATVKDINWLMGQAVGWNSGIELDLNINEFKKNPQFDEIVSTIQKWETARTSGKITDAQKMLLRQTDCVYTIEPKSDGTWDIKLLERWTHPKCKKLDSDVVKLTSLDKNVKPEKCSIDLSWTHSPLVLDSAAVSDDMPMLAGKVNEWTVQHQAQFGDINRKQFKFVLRVPSDSPCGIKDPVITANNQTFQVPVTLKPGQYLATPLNVPMVFVYNKDHVVINEVPIRYANDLPDINGRDKYNVKCQFESSVKGKTPKVFMNIFYAVTMKVSNYGATQGEAPTKKIDYDKNDLALFKPVTASVGHEGDHTPEKAVNKNRSNGDGWYGGNNGKDRWIQVDLGEEITIESVHALFYSDGKRYYNYQVEVSTDGKDWKVVADNLKSKKPSTRDGIMHTFKPVKARYVRLNKITNSANKSCHLIELSVYAKGKTPK